MLLISVFDGNTVYAIQRGGLFFFSFFFCSLKSKFLPLHSLHSLHNSIHKKEEAVEKILSF